MVKVIIFETDEFIAFSREVNASSNRDTFIAAFYSIPPGIKYIGYNGRYGMVVYNAEFLYNNHKSEPQVVLHTATDDSDRKERIEEFFKGIGCNTWPK